MKRKNTARPSEQRLRHNGVRRGGACRGRPVEGGEQADTEGRRAADAIKKNPSKQRPPYEVSAAVSGARAPERPIGPAPTGTTPDGRHEQTTHHQQTSNRQ